MFALAGFLVSTIFAAVWLFVHAHPTLINLSERDFLQKLTLILWPSSILLMLTEGGGVVRAHVVLAVAMLCNVLLYGLVGLLVSWLRKALWSR